MAETVAINIEVDGGDSVNEIKRLEQEVKELEESFLALEDAEKSQSNSLEVNSEKNVDSIKKISKAQQTLGDDANNVAKTMVTGYTAFLGVTALVGTDQEQLVKTFIKLQSVTQTLNAVQKLSNDLKKEGTTRQSLQNIATKIGTAGQKAYALATGTGTKAMGLFKKALISTGIGALLVGVGLLVAYWDDLVNYFSDGSAELKEQQKVLEENQELIDEQLSKAELNLQLAQSKGESGQAELLIIKQTLNAQLEQNTLLAENLRLQLDKEKSLNKEYTWWERIKATARNMAGEDIRKLRKEYQNEESEETKEIANSLNTAEENILKTKIRIANIDKDENTNNNNKAKERKTKREQELKEIENYNNEVLNLQRQLEDTIISMEKDNDVRALAQLEVKQDRELEALKKSKYYSLEQQKILEEKQALEMDALIEQIEADGKIKADEKLKENAQALADLKKEIRDAEVNTLAEQRELDFEELDLYYSELIQRAKENNENTLNLEETFIAKQKELKDKNDKEDKAREKESLDSKLANIQSEQQARDSLITGISSGITGLISLGKDSEKKQKAMALVQIATDTALAISSLVAQSQANALNGATFGVAGAVQFATGIISILGNMAKAKQLLSGGSGVSAPNTSVGAPPQNLTTTMAGNNSNNNIGSNTSYSTANGGGKVMLVESELELMQSRRENMQRIATI